MEKKSVGIVFGCGWKRSRHAMKMLPGFLCLAVFSMLLTACGSDSGSVSTTSTPSGSAPTGGDIVVTAKSALFEGNTDQFENVSMPDGSSFFKAAGNSNTWASWSPGKTGTFEIYVKRNNLSDLPANTYFKVLLDEDHSTVVSPDTGASGEWAKLKDADQNTAFEMSTGGRLFIFLGADEAGYPLDATNTDPAKQIELDSVKFVPASGNTLSVYTPIIVPSVENDTDSDKSLSKTVEAAVISIPSFTLDGYTVSQYVDNGRWQGQPPSAPNHGKYMNFYALETVDSSKNTYWVIKGSGFGSKQGKVNFSNTKIRSSILSWNDREIKIVPAADYSFRTDSAVTMSVFSDTNRELARKAIPVIGLIKTRGFGQCTWYVAYKRKSAGLTVPPSAYAVTKQIDASYVPSLYDCLTYGSKHVAIISSIDPPKIVTNKDKSSVTTYKMMVGEANAKYDEAIYDTGEQNKPYPAEFIIYTDKNGKKTFTNNIDSFSGFKATGYWR